MKCPQFGPLFSSMRSANKDMERFVFTFNNVEFDAIVSIDETPFELLVGATHRNWACTMKILPGYIINMDDRDFFDLCYLLNLKPGKESFLSSHFLAHIARHCPAQCSSELVNPKYLVKYRGRRVNAAEEPEKTVFLCWDEHKDGKRARNFDKTQKYFGKRVADFCRRNNISSKWTTPDKANYPNHVDEPPGYI